MLRSITYQLLVCGIILFFPISNIRASEPTHEKTQKHENEAFKPGEFIVDHILDAHDWHITTIGGRHISIPLPIIVISTSETNKGIHCFMSYRFHHGHAEYRGFKLSTEGDYKGKIIEVATGKPVALDISITKNVLAIFISILLLLFVFISVARAYKRNVGKAPKGIQSAVEPFIVFIRDDIAKPSIGHKYEKFMPYLLTIFFFIWVNNMMGLIPIFPGGANVTGNIAVTMCLAILTFLITSFSANKNYWKHIFNAPGVPWWLKIPIPLMPIIEIIGMFTKPFVLMVRLFANISAGHIIALGFISLIFIFGNMHPLAGYGISILSVLFVIFMTVLELLVALIQAYVFTLLSALYFGMATEEHH